MERIEDRVESHSSFSVYMVLLLFLILILLLSTTTYFYWRKLRCRIHANNNEAVEIHDEQIDDIRKKLQKECSYLSSQLKIKEKEFREEHIRRMRLEQKMDQLDHIIIKEKEENEFLKMEIKKCNDRIYSIENKLKKAEYDNRQLEEKLSQDKETTE